MNLLEVNNICKTYSRGEAAVLALKNVSFSVPKGEYVAIVGESGSGKSTLLNMVGALDTPTTGKTGPISYPAVSSSEWQSDAP